MSYHGDDVDVGGEVTEAGDYQLVISSFLPLRGSTGKVRYNLHQFHGVLCSYPRHQKLNKRKKL